METEGSLSCSLEPAAGPYPSQINPVRTTSSFPFLYYLSTYVYVLLVVYFFLAFPP
jgi:hypothetical protein